MTGFCLKTGLLSNRGAAATIVGTLSPLGASRGSFEHICTENAPILNRIQKKHRTDRFDHLHSTYKCRQHVMVDSGGSVVELVLQGSGDGCSSNRLGRSDRRLLGVEHWWMGSHYTTRCCASCRGRVRRGWRRASLTQSRGFTLRVCCQTEGKR